MNYYKKEGQMNLSDRIAIETGISSKDSFKTIGKLLHTEDEVVEMDTVKGVREQGKRLLTMIFRKNNVMLLFLMPDGKAESVKRVFDYLEAGLGIELFRRLFPVILTDNGSEFKKVKEKLKSL